MAIFAFYPPSGGGGSANASVGPNGQPIPTSATLVAGENPSGALQPLQTDASGALIVTGEAGGPSLNTNVAEWGGVATSLGQKLAASSVPVVLASDTVLPLPTGAATSALQSTGNTSLASILANQTNGTQIIVGDGTAGVPAGGVVSVQGVSGGTPIPVAPSAGPADIKPATLTITAQDTASTSTSQANGQLAITGTPTAGSAAVFALSSVTAIEVQTTGTWTGTLVCEVSMDGGVTYYTNGIKQTGAAYLSSAFTANFEGKTNVAAITNVRVRSTAAWTGTATVRVVESVNPSTMVISNPLTLRDATTQSISNTIKAASTAPVATDTALVVAISPNSVIPSPTAATPVSFSFTSATSQSYSVGQYSVVGVNFTSVGSSNIIIPEVSVDGTNWVGTNVYTPAGGTAEQFTAVGSWQVNVAGFQFFRIFIALYNSGTISGTIFAVGGAGFVVPLGQQDQSTSLAVTLSNEDVQDLYVIGASGQTATVNNILTSASGSAATDLTGYRTAFVQVINTGTLTSGAYSFETSNDNINFTPALAYVASGATGSIINGPESVGAGNQLYAIPVSGRFFRLRISTAIGGGGSIQAFSKFSQTAWVPGSVVVSQSVSSNLVANIGSGFIINEPVTPTQQTDIASAAIGSTATSGTITPSYGSSYNTTIDVTAVSGTPTMQVTIQESSDQGTNWYNVYSFPAITAIGSYTSPSLPLTGNRLRYVQTIVGSTSLTRSITRNQASLNVPVYREYTDYSISPTTTNSATAVLQTNGASNLTMIVNQGTGGSAVTFALDGSFDNVNWVNSIATVVGVVGGATPVSVVGPNVPYLFIRGRVVLGVASTTISYVSLSATGTAQMPTAQQVSASQGAITDGSGTTSGTPSTSSQIFAANGARKYLFIQNLDPTNSIWINFTSAASATAAGSIQLIANAAFVQEASFVSTEAINVLSAVASTKFTAKQG